LKNKELDWTFEFLVFVGEAAKYIVLYELRRLERIVPPQNLENKEVARKVLRYRDLAVTAKVSILLYARSIRLTGGWDSLRTAPVCAFDSEGQGHMSQGAGKFVWRAVEKIRGGSGPIPIRSTAPLKPTPGLNVPPVPILKTGQSHTA